MGTRTTPTDLRLYRRALDRCFPQLAIRTCRPILDGWSSLVLEVNGELIFRFPRRPEIVAALEKEMVLLPELARSLPVAVPRFEFIGRGGVEADWPFVGYRKIDGRPLGSALLASTDTGRLARDLAQVLSALHRFPVERAVQLRVPPAGPQDWRQEYRRLYAWTQRQVLPLLPPALRDRAAALWEGFLEEEDNFHFQPVLIHRDLAGEHILCDADRGAVVGIIDWEDTAVGDPALDFVGLLCDAGPELAAQVLADYQGQVDPTFWQRMAFYARICPVYEIQFGLAIGDEEHLRHGLEGLREVPARPAPPPG